MFRALSSDTMSKFGGVEIPLGPEKLYAACICNAPADVPV